MSKQCPLWPALRHYIGRLGSWWRAIIILTSTAQDSPYIFHNFRVKPVSQRAIVASTSVCEGVGIDYALSHVLQDNDLDRVSQVQKYLEDRWGDEASAEFRDRYARRTTKPSIHAELSILEHFYRNNLSYVGGDRYIGCSKPSCYCCDLYMQLHPHKVSQRPSHGNVWVKWCLPIQEHAGSTASGSTDILKRMVEKMRLDIFSGCFPTSRSRMPESTTGITKT